MSVTTRSEAIPVSSRTMNTELSVPEGAGPFPVVILFHDAGGLRDAMTHIATRIARMGYVVATPDLFHRTGSPWDLAPGKPHEASTIGAILADPALRTRFFRDYYAPALAYDGLRADVTALLDHLAARADVTSRVATTGYCMGGNASLRVGTLLGDRIALTASFHGGGLATAEADSPHLRAASLRSRVYVAGAVEDSSFDDAQRAQLVEAFANAKVDARVETYPARHGFVVSDNPTFDEVAAERHYAVLEALLAETLR
ncbi:MAG: hypothetical protein JWP97_3554 [Labilithrix sp.]|nr:hypothetical protein [Labilithrix sp.]